MLFRSRIATICDSLNFDFLIGSPWMQNPARKVANERLSLGLLFVISRSVVRVHSTAPTSMGPGAAARAILAAIVLAASALALAQQPGHVYRIGWLAAQEASADGEKLFFDRLASLGFVEGKNLSIARKGSDRNREEHAALARALVAGKPDVLVSRGTPDTRLLQSLTATIPIVFLGTANPVEAGLVKTLAHPGGNITGVSNQQCEMAAKLIELARELVPRAKHVAIIVGGAPGKNACAASLAQLDRKSVV